MGVKISALPQSVLPYSGSEEIPLVQASNFEAGETRAGTLSSFVNYLSGDFAFYNRTNNFTRSQTISGDLTVTGTVSATVFNAVSANFSIIDIKQYELSGFNVTGDISITGDLSATGDAVFRGSLSATGDVNIFGDSYTAGDVIFGSSLSAAGNAIFDGSLSAKGNVTTTGNSYTTGDAIFYGSLSTIGSSTYTGPGVYNVDTPQDALRITQRGPGLALRVEDETSTDSTPFVITSGGNVGIGTVSPGQKLTVVGNISATGSITTSDVGVIDTSSSQDALRITQRGPGLALRVEDEANVDSTPFVITSGGDVGIGIATPNSKLTVVGNTSATGVAYTLELDFGSQERPSITGVKQALNSFLYVAPALSYVRANGSSSLALEVGQALVAPAITWTSNKVEAAAVTNYLLTLPTGATSTGIHTFSGYNDTNTYNITTLPGTNTQATSAWSVRVTDWNGAQSTSSVSASWRYKVYYGTTTQASPTDAQVRAGSETDTLAISRTGLGSKTVTPSNEYMYVAYPVRFNTTAQFRVNGLPNTAFTLITISNFENASGGTADYYVYRSDNLLTGTYTIEII
jgi:hypothetical protein